MEMVYPIPKDSNPIVPIVRPENGASWASHFETNLGRIDDGILGISHADSGEGNYLLCHQFFAELLHEFHYSLLIFGAFWTILDQSSTNIAGSWRSKPSPHGRSMDWMISGHLTNTIRDSGGRAA